MLVALPVTFNDTQSGKRSQEKDQKSMQASAREALYPEFETLRRSVWKPLLREGHESLDTLLAKLLGTQDLSPKRVEHTWMYLRCVSSFST
jgi:hypothetical protein